MRFDDIVSSILIIIIFFALYSINVFVTKYNYITLCKTLNMEIVKFKLTVKIKYMYVIM